MLDEDLSNAVSKLVQDGKGENDGKPLLVTEFLLILFYSELKVLEQFNFIC